MLRFSQLIFAFHCCAVPVANQYYIKFLISALNLVKRLCLGTFWELSGKTAEQVGY